MLIFSSFETLMETISIEILNWKVISRLAVEIARAVSEFIRNQSPSMNN